MHDKTNNIITPEELNTILLHFLEKSKESNLNAYDFFINQKKQEENEKKNITGKNKIVIEKHHIIPKFDGGTDDPANIILLTTKEHVIAHWLRWKVLEKNGDYCAFLFRVGNTEQAIALQREQIIKARERDRIEKKSFFDPEFQK